MYSTHQILAFMAQQLTKTYRTALSAIHALSIIALVDSQQGEHSRFRSRKLLAYPAVFLCVLVAFAVYSRGDGLFSIINSGPSRTDIPKDQFIAAILREPIEGLVDPDPIRKKCNETKFQEGLVWHCAAVKGGIGNVANELLNCVRYAIEAGATILILPRISSRAENLIDLGNEDQTVEMSYLFDMEYFFDSWKLACPQIQAVFSDSEVPNLPSSDSSPHLFPGDVKKFEMRKYLIVDSTGWREAFDIWLAKNAPSISAETPVRVWQNLVLAQWNREAHPPEFANSFPRLFRYPTQTRRLAASALWSLGGKLGRPVVSSTILYPLAPLSSSMVNSLGPHRLVNNGFLGAHMRVAADAAAAGWPGYEAQAPFYIAEAKRLNLTTIYLATGSVEHRERFRVDAAREGLGIIVKEDLLDEKELADLQNLTWDQQALVDFDVLMHSTWFYGFVRSSFSWSLALRRSTLPEAGTASEVTKMSKDEYRDNISAIVGRYDNINPEGLWP